MTWRQIIPTIVTLAAMLSGFFSILVTLEGMRYEDPGQYHRWAAQLIMLAMILDGLDGNLARRLKGTSELGGELDTYVDMTAFGIAPALLIYVVSLQSSLFWRVIMTAAIVLSGVVRLARFKATDPARGQQGYCGLPITASAGWVAVFVFISQTEPVDRFSLNQGPVAAFFLLGVLLFITLQVSTVRYPKPTKKMGLFVPCVVLVVLTFFSKPFALPSAIIMIAAGVGYVLLGPVVMRRLHHRESAAPH